MKRIVVMLFSVLAIFAVSGVAAGSASAVIRCVKVRPGNPSEWENGSKCSVPRQFTGEETKVNLFGVRVGANVCAKVEAGLRSKFETNLCEGALSPSGYVEIPPQFVPAGGGFPVAFTSANKTGTKPVLFTKSAKIKITCNAESASGELTGATTVGKVVVKYTGCTAENTSTKKSCGEAKTKGGSTAGEIATNKLKGEVGESTGSVVAQILEPEETGGQFVEIEFEKLCGVVKSGKVTGQVVAKVEPVDEESTKGKLIFETSGEEQVLKTFNGSGSKELLAFGALPSALQAEEEVTFAEPVLVS